MYPNRPSDSGPHYRVAIVGAGFAGIGMAIRLLQSGERRFVVLERADRVGGVWRDNVYPGAACDVQARLYALSSAPNPDWSERFAGQEEILAYLEETTDRLGVRRHLRLGHAVERAAWDEEHAHWAIETSQGCCTADILVAAPGGLSEPLLPPIPGLDTFAGTAMHTARWDPSVDGAGLQVAVIGTGASAIQVVPALQLLARRLTLFQRTPPWIVSRRNRPLAPSLRAAASRLPVLGAVQRRALYGFREVFGLAFRHPRLAAAAEGLARLHLRRQVADPALRRLLTPAYRFGCKRILLSDDFYPALQEPNVTLVPGAARRIHPHGVEGPDGVVHPADVLVLATGFHVSRPPFGQWIWGRGGRRLWDTWGESPRAHLGTTVPGFPNLFVLQGPNTGLGHSSVVLMAEAQMEHVANALAYMDRHGVRAVEPQPAALQAFVDEVDRRAANTVWNAGGCQSWYLDATGRNAALWPGSIPAFVRRVAPFRPAEYRRPPVAERAPQPSTLMYA